MKTAAIIPAYNEEKTIGSVLAVLRQCPLIDQIVVVSDGSTDQTVQRALQHGVEVIELLENRGKGGALKAGLDHSDASVLLFLDADLIGLTKKHVRDLLLQVIEGKASMTLGLFEKGRVATDLAQRMAPFLSGQRALKTDLLQGSPTLIFPGSA